MFGPLLLFVWLPHTALLRLIDGCPTNWATLWTTLWISKIGSSTWLSYFKSQSYGCTCFHGFPQLHRSSEHLRIDIVLTHTHNASPHEIWILTMFWWLQKTETGNMHTDTRKTSPPKQVTPMGEPHAADLMGHSPKHNRLGPV